MRPNTSVNLTRYGRRRLAAPGHGEHRPSAASRHLPPRAGYRERYASNHEPELLASAWPAPRFSLGSNAVAAYCGPAGWRVAADNVVRLEEEQPKSLVFAMVDSPHSQAPERSTPSQFACASRSKPRPHNPSLNRTRIGMPRCPRSAHAYDALRGQRVMPLCAGYRKR
jgi:hypothetical protein